MSTKRLSLFFYSTLALAAGCSQVLGLGDYEVDPSLDGPAAAAGEGGEAGQGGTQPSGGTNQAGSTSVGGEPTQAGAGGTRGGEAGAAGAAGAGGDAPGGLFVGCDGQEFNGNEAILRSCILRVSCQYWQYPSNTISRCISQNTQNAYEGTKCTLDAQTCDDITACEGVRHERSFCDGLEKGQYCDGNEVIDCAAFAPYARDCTKYGGTCYDFGVALPSGKTVDCALDAVTTCTATTTTDACGGPQNGYRYQCEGNVAYGTRCSNFAASCQDVGGDIGCYYPSNICDTEGVTCTNGRATWCDGDTRVTYDCGSVGLGCSTAGDYYEDLGRQCSAPGCTRDDIAECEESCDGSKLTVCYGGAPVTVDCKDYGFDVCVDYDFDCSKDGSLGDCLYTSDIVHFAECEYED